MDAVTPVRQLGDAGEATGDPPRGLEALLEQGAVLSLARQPFVLLDGERRFLDPGFADGKAKNISLRWPAAELRGATGTAAELAELEALLVRYAEFSEALALRLFPHYRGALRRGNGSLRLAQAAGRASSWRHDDRRLHVDAFPSNPMRGTRLLRVFCNVSPQGEPRRWRVGEPFEAHARRFLPAIGRPLPGASWLLHRLRVTKRRRTEYDHVMLQLHDRAKADAGFQRTSPQAEIALAPGTTWLVYSDQVPHAVTAGRCLLEQTFYLDVEHMLDPETSPLRTLERLLGRALR
jgi:3-deoxy-D-manno-oct-2-ulosonic acid (Kdo) hydroxylase